MTHTNASSLGEPPPSSSAPDVSESFVSEDYLRGFVAGRYLAGARGRKLLNRVPEAWMAHPNWELTKRLVAALSSSSRSKRAAALAPELAGLMRSVEKREIEWD